MSPTGGVSAPAEKGKGCLANWVWVSDLQQWDRALVVNGQTGNMAGAMAGHFTTVLALESDLSASTRTRQRRDREAISNVMHVTASVSELAFDKSTFDCIVLHGTVPRSAGLRDESGAWPQLTGLLADCYKLLRPGGCLYLAAINPLWYRHQDRSEAESRPAGSLVSLARAARRTITAVLGRSPKTIYGLPNLLRKVGFRHIRPYYLMPSIDEPAYIVPANRRSVTAYEMLALSGSTRNHVRKWAGRLGLHALLFPSHLILACR